MIAETTHHGHAHVLPRQPCPYSGTNNRSVIMKLKYKCHTFLTCAFHTSLVSFAYCFMLATLSSFLKRCYGYNTKSTRYSCYSGNVPGLHILLWVKLLTPFTSGLPFLLCSSFVLTLLIRKHCLIVLSFHSIVLCSQTYLRSITPNSLLCSISGYSACCTP